MEITILKTSDESTDRFLVRFEADEQKYVAHITVELLDELGLGNQDRSNTFDIHEEKFISVFKGFIKSKIQGGKKIEIPFLITRSIFKEFDNQ